MAKNKTEEVKTEKVRKFTREQFIKSERFKKHKDILNALLENKSYSITEVEEIINDFLYGKRG